MFRLNVKNKLVWRSASASIVSISLLSLTTGCASYSDDELSRLDNKEKPSQCINMEPAQELKCKEREKTLALTLSKSCNSPFAYERNRCQAAQGKKDALLKASIKKHEK